MADRITDDRLAYLIEGWEHESKLHDMADEYHQTCKDTAIALSEVTQLRARIEQLESDMCAARGSK